MAAEIQGLKELINKLKDIQDKVQDEQVDKVLMQAAQHVKDEIRANCPTDTGALRESIIATYGKPKGPDGVRDVVVLSKTGDVPYGPFVEYGTSKRPAQPFFRPGVAQAKSEVKKILAEGLKNILKGAK